MMILQQEMMILLLNNDDLWHCRLRRAAADLPWALNGAGLTDHVPNPENTSHNLSISPGLFCDVQHQFCDVLMYSPRSRYISFTSHFIIMVVQNWVSGIRNDELCIRNDELCIENDGFCIENRSADSTSCSLCASPGWSPSTRCRTSRALRSARWRRCSPSSPCSGQRVRMITSAASGLLTGHL